MGNLPVPAGSGVGLSRLERRIAKDIALTRAASSALAAREAAKIDAIADVAGAALLATADVSNLEALLAVRTPHAAGRFALIGDRASVAMADRLRQMARSL